MPHKLLKKMNTMIVTFSIHYHTTLGQQLCITGSTNGLGQWNVAQALRMHYTHDGHWTVQLNVAETEGVLEYKYLILDQQGHLTWEDGENRVISLSGQTRPRIYVAEAWRSPSNIEKSMSTAAFTKVIMQPGEASKAISHSTASKTLQFKIQVPRVSSNYKVCVLGNQAQLGHWDITRPFILGCGENFPLWTGSIDASDMMQPIRYKYGIYDITKKRVVTLEEGSDREIDDLPINDAEYRFIRSDEGFRYPTGNWRAAGVAVPVFSLRTDKGFGVGEFPDLLDFVDWAKQVELKMIQLLPINETVATHSWLDSYPYKSISVVALHPIYLNLEKVGVLKDKKKMAEYAAARKRLNKNIDVDYLEVLGLKSKYFKLVFDEVKKDFFKDPDYLAFYGKNKDWLDSYAAFAFLRDKMGTADFRKWSKHSVYHKEQIDRLVSPRSPDWDDISIHYFLQYHLDKQLREVTDYAHENGIVLKGDIPIGISPNSVEAWIEPHLYHLNAQAGAPPDDFAVKGQNWGFPTYNWEAMEKEDYAWWKKRLRQMAEYFDAYRIDHILGFFRIWEIPLDAVEGLLGYFNPALPMTAEEIQGYGIDFSPDRFAKPYIRVHLVERIFGEFTQEVINKYLDGTENGAYKLKDAFATQLKVNAHFLRGIEEEDLKDDDRKIRDGLFDLIANVLFIQSGENQWHPRITLHLTSSYEDLDEHTKGRLKDLYNHYFYSRHDDFWHQKGMEKLPAIISASDMLVCGEDLGMVPACVPPVMDQMAILTLEIQRMSKNPATVFGHPGDAPYLSVCTTSTHDMATIRGWWEEDKKLIQQFFNTELGNDGEAPYFAEPWVCQQIINQHLHSPAMWTTFPIQDLIAMDGDFRWEETHLEKINEPSNVRHKWRFRMHQSVDDLKNAEAFNHQLRSMIEESGRNTDY